MATKKKQPAKATKKAKPLKGGTNGTADSPLIPIVAPGVVYGHDKEPAVPLVVDSPLTEEDVDGAEAKLTPDASAAIDNVVDQVVPHEKNGQPIGTVTEAVDEVLEKTSGRAKSRIEQLADRTVEGMRLADAARKKLEADPNADVSAETNRINEILSADPDSPGRLAEWDAATRRMLKECADDVDQCQEEYDLMAKEAKDAKAALEAAWTRQHKTIRDREAGRGKPVQQELFDKTEGHAAAQPDVREPSEIPTGDESWRLVPLTELVETDGLPAKVAQLFGDAGLNTMGDVSDYTKPKASGWTDKLTDIKGVGPAKVEAWQAAEERFWKRWKPVAAQPDAAPVDKPVESTGEQKTAEKSTAEPAGYHNADVDRIGKAKRKSQRKRK